MKLKKNMSHGSRFLIKFVFVILFQFQSLADDKISSSPLLNLNEIEPSFDDTDLSEIESTSTKNLKNKLNKNKTNSSKVTLIGLDKITAKSSKILVNLNEEKKFGPLEIKILKCEKIKNHNKIDDVAYMQVKDLTKNENEKVFIFNGWTFASDPNITPFDHAVYDIQLTSCNA